MKRLKEKIALLVLFSFPLGVFASSKQEYENVIKGQMKVLLTSHFILLGKDFADLALTFHFKLRQHLLQLADVRDHLDEVKRQLAAGAGVNLKLLREAALIKKETASLMAQATTEAEAFYRLEQIPAGYCKPEKLAVLEKEFDSTSVFQIKKMLEDFNESIKKVVKEGIESAGGLSFGITINQAQGGPALTYTRPIGGGGPANNYQDAVVGTCTAIGASIGALAGGIGAPIGALIGNIVGCLLVGIFVKAPEVIFTEKIHAEIDNVVAAVEGLRGNAAKEMIPQACNGAFADKQFLGLFTAAGKTARDVTAEMAKAEIEINRNLSEIEDAYKVALDTLVKDHVPVFVDSFNDKFEAHLKKERERSAESRKYCDESVAPVVKSILEEKSVWKVADSEQKLWDLFVDGDLRFTKGPGFSFDDRTDKLPAGLTAVKYWDGATQAIIETLEEK